MHKTLGRCKDRGCLYCVPLPEVAAVAEAAHGERIPCYFGTDPDGHEWIHVSTRYAGQWGENLAFKVVPYELGGKP
jgi:hypothetical protein